MKQKKQARARKRKHSTITQAEMIELLKKAGEKGMSSNEIAKAGYVRNMSNISADLPVYTEKIKGKDYWFYVDYNKMYKGTSKTYLVIPCSSDDAVLKFYSLEIVALFLNTSVKEVKESLETGTELNGYCIDEAI